MRAWRILGARFARVACQCGTATAIMMLPQCHAPAGGGASGVTVELTRRDSRRTSDSVSGSKLAYRPVVRRMFLWNCAAQVMRRVLWVPRC